MHVRNLVFIKHDSRKFFGRGDFHGYLPRIVRNQKFQIKRYFEVLKYCVPYKQIIECTISWSEGSVQNIYAIRGSTFVFYIKKDKIKYLSCALKAHDKFNVMCAVI